MRLRTVLIAVVAIVGNAAIAAPLGLPPVPIPADNLQTPEIIALGDQPFHDTRFSAVGKVSCATCHEQARAFTDNLPVSEGVNSLTGTRNAPTVINSAYMKTLFWDGREPDLEGQSRQPPINPKSIWPSAILAVLGTMSLILHVQADEFTDDDLDRWQMEYEVVVDEGENLFHGGLGNANTVSCDQCHPNGANTHPETYPKFQQQLGRVAALWEMINWCIQNPLEADMLAADDPKMIALQSYITEERKGAELEAGNH